jgi:hypothetical protein
MQENANLDHSEIGSIEVATAMVFVQSQLPQKGM